MVAYFHLQPAEIHLNSMSIQLDVLYKKDEHILLIGDLNSETSEDALSEFCCVCNNKQANML